MSDAMRRAMDRQMLDRAARCAWRGFGRVEPNPMVGCVIGTREGRVLATGHHRVFGGAHAEIDALEACRGAGHDPRGTIAWVTLEPCAHTGKTPPCARALIQAGVAEVVYARRDPHEASAGGAVLLEAAGVATRQSDASARALRVSDPFVKGVGEGLPWVIAKWAQSIDGRIATESGDSQWITGARARRMVHAVRARCDAVLTGAGTVERDDPRLTARGVPVRRVARRVVLDSTLRLGDGSRLLATLDEAPLTVACTDGAPATRRAALQRAGAEVVVCPGDADGRPRPGFVLRHLYDAHGATTVLVEAGGVLTGSLLDAGLVDEIHAWTGPVVIGSGGAPGPVSGRGRAELGACGRWSLVASSRFGDDVLSVYRRGDADERC